MSSPIFARTDRHRLLGLLLAIRTWVYLLAGVPFLVFSDLGTAVAIPALLVLAFVAFLP